MEENLAFQMLQMATEKQHAGVKRVAGTRNDISKKKKMTYFQVVEWLM